MVSNRLAAAFCVASIIAGSFYISYQYGEIRVLRLELEEAKSQLSCTLSLYSLELADNADLLEENGDLSEIYELQERNRATLEQALKTERSLRDVLCHKY